MKGMSVEYWKKRLEEVRNRPRRVVNSTPVLVFPLKERKTWEDYGLERSGDLRERITGSEGGKRIEFFIDGRWMARSRYLMEEELGRKLTSEEVVHHINGNTLDDDLENLQVMTRSSHIGHHNKNRSQ